MEKKRLRLLFSASLACFAGGCATAPKAALEIRNVDHPQLVSSDQRAIERGKELLQRGQYADAISAFRKAMRQEANSAEANNGLAIAYDRIGRKDLARRYFELAVAEKPGETRYRTNLARFFESSGQPEHALGLLEASLAEVAVAPDVALPDSNEVLVATAAGEPQTESLSGPAENPIAAILADLSVGTINDMEPAAAVTSVASPTVAGPAVGKPAKPSFAVYRPSAEAAIEAMPINLPPPLPPSRAPFEDRMTLIADLPRNERKPTETIGPYIERISLGEVKLVTLPLSVVDDDAIDFDHLGRKLALWAEDERRRDAYESRAGLKGRFAIQNAIERAAIAEAIASLASTVEQMDSDFAYASFTGESDIEGMTVA